jgi:YidC/Oxa1 family membrane protein insertase
MDIQRLILFFIFSFSLLLLWDAWQKEQQPKPAPAASAPSAPGVPTPAAPLAPAPAPAGAPAPAAAAAPAASVPGAATAPSQTEKVRVSTDLIEAEIDTLGATLTQFELRKHKDVKDATKNFVLLGPEHAYSAQSGLIGERMPNHRDIWRALPGERTLGAGAERLQVRFAADGPGGVTVEKVYTFHRNSYLVDVAFELKNAGDSPVGAHAYYQVVRDGRAPVHESAMMYVYTGPVYYTAENAYNKVEFSDLDKVEASLPKNATDGWIGMMQHYFVSAWLPPEKAPREFYARKLPDGLYAAGVILATPPAAPGGSASVGVKLFSGPQEQSRLKQAAPGLDLVVDYGWLAIIAWPLFAVLEFFHRWTGNWGVAIILLTVLIKLVFFPLSAASYKSMAKMKLVTPRLTKIREMYAHDRARMNQGELGLGHLHRQHARQALAHVVAGGLHSCLLGELGFLDVAVEHARHRGAQAGEVCAAVLLRDVVGEADDVLLVGVVPLHRHIHADAFLFPLGAEDVGVQHGLRAIHVLDEALHAAGEGEILLLADALIDHNDAHAVVQKGQLAQPAREDVVVEVHVAEYLARGEEMHFRAAFLARARHAQRRRGHAVGELQLMHLAVAPDGQPQPAGERVHDRDAHAVQAAGHLVGIRVELAAGVQLGHHDLGRRALELVVLFDAGRDAAAVVQHRYRIVGMDGDHDLVAEARQGLVHGVVHHLEHHVMQPRTVRGVANVHAGALAHRLQALQDLDAVGAVLVRVWLVLLGFFHSRFLPRMPRCASA